MLYTNDLNVIIPDGLLEGTMVNERKDKINNNFAKMRFVLHRYNVLIAVGWDPDRQYIYWIIFSIICFMLTALLTLDIKYTMNKVL
ncbi:hypothetical protein [Virgibacillus sp. DJP39]|uniref:hypothetical protein n=1 Tax=Virgibacillus sp. DJP39 TaxID=3409790 RepID=UPI003BB5F50C